MRERGLEGASVDEVMKAAGMTHGGFYKHFDTKEALIEAAIDAAFAGFAEPLEHGEPERAVAAYRALYLSDGHKNHPGIGCPVASEMGMPYSVTVPITGELTGNGGHGVLLCNQWVEVLLLQLAGGRSPGKMASPDLDDVTLTAAPSSYHGAAGAFAPLLLAFLGFVAAARQRIAGTAGAGAAGAGRWSR